MVCLTYVFVSTTTLDLSPFSTRSELGPGKIRHSVVFSSALETLANHSLPTGSISQRVFYICHWLYLSSVQQRRSCFLPCRFRQFSSLPGKTHSSRVSAHVFPFLFCKHFEILRKPDDLFGSLQI